MIPQTNEKQSASGQGAFFMAEQTTISAEPSRWTALTEKAKKESVWGIASSFDIYKIGRAHV